MKMFIYTKVLSVGLINQESMPIPKALKPWKSFLDSYQEKHPNLSLKECMKKASPLYQAAKRRGGSALSDAFKKYSKGKGMQMQGNYRRPPEFISSIYQAAKPASTKKITSLLKSRDY